LNVLFYFVRYMILAVAALSILNTCQAIDKFVHHDDFPELAKFHLKDADWQALSAYQNILEVRICLLLLSDLP
jgi:hypothetical protein